MKVARVVMLADDYAVVHLRPSWLARLFGAKAVMCELMFMPDGTQTTTGHSLTGRGWHCKRTHSHIGWMNHGTLLLYALQFQPVVSGDSDVKTALPRAWLLEGQE